MRPTNDVYIADSTQIIPQLYDSIYLAEKLYDPHKSSEKAYKIARRFAHNIAIKQRPSVLDVDAIPRQLLKCRDYSPVNWGKTAINDLTEDNIAKEEIGYFGIAYNTSSHLERLPNLVSRIVGETNLKLDLPPEEHANYGCAGGFFPLQKAIEYCRTSQKAAIVFVFDQCLMGININYDTDSPLFLDNLKPSLLFSDGGVALLIVPESFKCRFKQNLLRIKDFSLYHEYGNAIGFKGNNFIIGDAVKTVMPDLVTHHLLKPLLERNNLLSSDIDEWSIHQGGTSVLKRFGESKLLGLSEEQLWPSLDMFLNYGNMSAPSCFLVLHHILKQLLYRKPKCGNGCVVGFGAGYYLGGLLYERLG